MRLVLLVVLTFALGACFNPQFNNPSCGPAGECPSGFACDQGTCRLIADVVDATGDGTGSDDAALDGPGPGDGSVDAPIDGPSIDAPPIPCVPTTCGGFQGQCGNCVDDDADGLVDYEDPDCLGPCDTTEDSLLMGVPGENMCPQDCYFDSNSGQGDDGCRWDLRCYMQQPVTMCPFQPSLLGGTQCPNNQSGSCTMACGNLTPNGCDCFGCCQVPGLSEGVYLGARDASGTATCTTQVLGDPLRCPRCTINAGCLNSCDNCEVCFARPLATGCTQQVCPAGRTRCGEPGQPACPTGQACITGCCFPTP